MKNQRQKLDISPTLFTVNSSREGLTLREHDPRPAGPGDRQGRPNRRASSGRRDGGHLPTTCRYIGKRKFLRAGLAMLLTSWRIVVDRPAPAVQLNLLRRGPSWATCESILDETRSMLPQARRNHRLRLGLQHHTFADLKAVV
ncbi:hypothetical protein ACU8WE_00010 [Pseudomonas parakoreensis]